MNIFKIILEWATSLVQNKLPELIEGLNKFGELLNNLTELVSDLFK